MNRRWKPSEPIRVWDYRRDYEQRRDVILAAVDRVFRSGTLILGPEVERFEAAFAELCGATHAIGVDNATNGLFLSLRTLDIGQGDEVITVPNTAVPTGTAILMTGATPRFIDIDPATALMDVTQLEQAIGPRTRAIIAVHLYGQCADMARIMPIAQKHGLSVIEDCSQAHGARHHGSSAGALGDLGVFSFYPTKPLGAFGDGGIVVTNNPDYADRLKRLRFYGMSGAYFSDGEGYNSRLDEVQAAILNVQLGFLPLDIERRRQHALRYDENLAGLPLTRFDTAPGNDHVRYLYPVRHPDRDNLLTNLRSAEIHLNVSYPWPLHVMPPFIGDGHRQGDFPQSEIHAREVFSLPMFPALAVQEIDYVSEVLTELLT